jgi:hypothetical protein
MAAGIQLASAMRFPGSTEEIGNGRQKTTRSARISL